MGEKVAQKAKVLKEVEVVEGIGAKAVLLDHLDDLDYLVDLPPLSFPDLEPDP